MYTTFQNGAIFNSSFGSYTVSGANWDEYVHTATEKDANGNVVQTLLGMPTSEQTNVQGAIMQTFQGGTMYWTAQHGSHVVYGAIGGAFSLATCGAPTADETNVPGVSGARMQ